MIGDRLHDDARIDVFAREFGNHFTIAHHDNAGGIGEVLIPGETGLMAEVGNPASFADKVQELLYNDELQKKFTDNGFEFLKNNFTKEVIAKKMFDELNEVLTASKK